MDLTVVNTESFSATFELSAWNKLFDFSAGVLRCQVRPTAESPVLLYEWATANDARGTAKGLIELLALKAAGLFTFTANPAAGDVVTLGSAVVMFVAGPASGNQVVIAPTLEATLSALVDLLQASSDPDISACTYTLAATTMLVEFKTAGLNGNMFEIGATGSAIGTSGPTLDAGGTSAVMSCPMGDIAGFFGTYSYDLRFEDTPTFAVLESGSMIFQQGVTR